ncbi:MAG: hydrogenase nickel incorporation protein HypB [Comamonadaceae bacterium]|nr:hydrogenase nickel incorporation protein HypB [Comamonadaceae bacterium]
MCVVCGCSQTRRNEASAQLNKPLTQAGTQTTSVAVDAPVPETGPRIDPRSGDLDYGAGAARVSVPGLSQARAIKLEHDILGANDRIAAHNREHFAAHGVLALNLVSSPGSGKTTLLCATIEALRQRHPALPVAVIEGDQQTAFDAERIRATGAPAIQINTGKGCHLDAPMVAAAFAQLHKHSHEQRHAHVHEHGHDHGHQHAHGVRHSHAHAHGHEHTAPSLLFIENVGNLVCPALWDLGERAKVAILSVTEGEDKPLKYPDMFAAARLMILNKIDLLPHVQFDVARCIELARRVNPSIEVLQVSATTGAGLDDWLHWLEHELGHDHDHEHGHGHGHGHGHERGAGHSHASEQALRERVAQLEAELAQLRHTAAAPG